MPDETMQSIAAENNLAETAFFVAAEDGYHLRWFTPTVEIDLCGHATLASGFVLWNCLGYKSDSINFDTRSGRLTVLRKDDWIEMDFPSRPPVVCEVHPALAAAMGGSPQEILAARDYLVVYRNAAEVLALRPDFGILTGIDRFAVIATSPGDDCDFVSRFFAPAQGIPEDPVTGSAHCTLTPYWSKRLGKKKMQGRQVSPRGGEILVEDRGDRVAMAGKAVLYLEGFITV